MDNPLPPCPGAPNCVRLSEVFEGEDAVVLFQRVRQELEGSGWKLAEVEKHGRRLSATARAFVFTDDVAVQVEQHERDAVLHLRSASRVGKHDLGVNGRRMRRFVERLRD